MSVGLLMAFGIAEGAMRLSGHDEDSRRFYDRKTGLHIRKPNYSYELETSCFRNTVHLNNFGFHATDFKEQKSDGTYRIAIVGDSFVAADQIGHDQSFWKLLEHSLNADPNRPHTYEVLPFGVGGQGTYLNALIWKQYAARFDPDLIIDLFAVSSDIMDDFDNPRVTPRFAQDGTAILDVPATPLYEAVKATARNSAVLRTLYGGYKAMRYREPQTVASQDGQIYSIPRYLDMYMRTPPNYLVYAWRKEEEILKAWHTLAESAGSAFLIVSNTEGYRVHPHLRQELAKDCPACGDPSLMDFENVERILEDIGARNAIPYFSMLPYFQRKAHDEPSAVTVWPCDGHWNQTGNTWAAEALHQYLTEHPALLGLHP